MPILTNTVTILMEIGATFFLCLFLVGFSVTYGSPCFRNSQVNILSEKAVKECHFEIAVCEQFKQEIGDLSMNQTEFLTLTGQYVDLRTTTMGSTLLCFLAVWIFVHSITLYYLFGGNNPLKKSTISGAMASMGADLMN
jgi:hypothetical protein